MSNKKSRRRRDAKQAAGNKAMPPTKNISEIVGSARFRSIGAFVLTCIGLYFLLNVLPPSFTKHLNEHTAAVLGLVLNVFGISVSTANDTVSGGGVAFKIIPECTPIFSVGLFTCFIIFYPASVGEKAAGIVIGIPAFYLGNITRLAITFMVTRYDRRLFEVVHVYLGQVFTMILVILACVLWMRWLGRERKQGITLKTAGFLARFGLISGCLFLVWIKVHHWYIWFLDRFVLFGFSLFAYHVPLASQTVFYYETFSVVLVVSLVLAARPVPWRRRIPLICTGLALLFFIHLFHRIDNALMAYFNYTAVLPVDLTLLVIGQYLIPVLFLIHLVGLQRQGVHDISA
ncbi:MAG TPA: exosortase H [Syntrophorhabdaceae bacterium]|nr:exosortase H [Syntrophorhabdaceae bacterium]